LEAIVGALTVKASINMAALARAQIKGMHAAQYAPFDFHAALYGVVGVDLSRSHGPDLTLALRPVAESGVNLNG